MNRFHLLVFVALVVGTFAVITSCIPTIPAPPLEEGDWQLLITTDEANSRLLLVSQPNNKIVNQNLFLNTDSMRGIAGRVGKVQTFRDYIFVLMPEARKIEVLSSTSYRRLATLNFATQNRIPSDIIFPNATTGYIAFSNASVLGVLDITNFTVPRDIEVGRNPVALDVRGNQVYCAVQGDNVIAVIDSRTNSVTARIPVPASPQFVRLSPNASELIVVSAGSTNPRTAARAALVSITEQRVLREAVLAINPADSLTERAYGLAVSEREFAYIPMNKALVRVDLRNLARTTPLEGTFRNVSYNPIRLEIVVADSSTMPVCTILSSASDSLKATIPLDSVRAPVLQVSSR